MSKLLVVFGATGQQGGSVVNYVVNDSALSKQFKVRAITRDISKPAAQALQHKGVEVVQGDADDKESLKHALKDAHTVFAVTVSVYDEKLYERELSQGKAMADAAVAAGVKYYIFSTLSHVGKESDGKLKNTGHFDVKADIEAYIASPQLSSWKRRLADMEDEQRTLPMKSAFFAPGSFMQNFATFMGPHPAENDTYAISNFVNPDTQLPLIEIVDDTGKFIGAILAEPAKYEGKVFSAATGLYSFIEVVETMSKISGKTVTYQQIPQTVWSGFLPPVMAGYMTDMFLWIQDYGYYGRKTGEEVKWSAEQARGKLTTLEEYLRKHPLHLQ